MNNPSGRARAIGSVAYATVIIIRLYAFVLPYISMYQGDIHIAEFEGTSSTDLKYALKLQTINHLGRLLAEYILGKSTNDLQLLIVCPSPSH